MTGSNLLVNAPAVLCGGSLAWILDPIGNVLMWERLLDRVQERGVALGMVFLDGSNVRAHQKAAGAAKGGICGRARCS